MDIINFIKCFNFNINIFVEKVIINQEPVYKIINTFNDDNPVSAFIKKMKVKILLKNIEENIFFIKKAFEKNEISNKINIYYDNKCIIKMYLFRPSDIKYITDGNSYEISGYIMNFEILDK